MSVPSTNGQAAPAEPAVPSPMELFQRGHGIDVLIPTLNEKLHIEEAVLNARTVGNVFVLDSLSTDGTQEIARKAGAHVVEHKFVDYAKQKNWGLENLPFTGEWVFILDADERFTPGLREELFRVAASGAGHNGYYVNRVVLYMGHAVRHGGLYPSWNLRFFRRGKARYEDRAVHEHMLCEGSADYLKDEMLHIRREPLHEWVRKHVRYADLESTEWLKMRMLGQQGAAPERLFRDVLKYRWYLRREVWPRMPFRPLLRFAYMYAARMGILDGRAGLRLAALNACYEYMIGLMYREKRQRLIESRARGLPSNTP